jgi:hypothetical protein
LAQALDQGLVDTVSIRPSFHGLQPISKDRKLQGYGVFLDIKNMEYKNVDDDSSAASSNAQQNGKVSDCAQRHCERLLSHLALLIPLSLSYLLSFFLSLSLSIFKKVKFNEDEEILGVNFAKLLRHHPEAISELRILRDELLEKELSGGVSAGGGGGGGIEGGLKVWKLKDLGLQTLQMFSSLSIKENTRYALTWLQEMIQDFPRYASQISSIKVTSQTRQDVMTWLQGQVASMLPMNALYLNGRSIDLDASTFNLFDLLDSMKEELVIRERIHREFASILSLIHSYSHSKGSASLSVSLSASTVRREVSDLLQVLDQTSSMAGVSEDPIEAQLGGAIRRVDVSKVSNDFDECLLSLTIVLILLSLSLSLSLSFSLSLSVSLSLSLEHRVVNIA